MSISYKTLSKSEYLQAKNIPNPVSLPPEEEEQPSTYFLKTPTPYPGTDIRK